MGGWRYGEPDDREISRQAIFKLQTKIYSKHHYPWIANTVEELDIQGNLRRLDESNAIQVRIKNPRINEGYKDKVKRLQIDPVIHNALYYHFYVTIPKMSDVEYRLMQFALFYHVILETNLSMEARKLLAFSPCNHPSFHPITIGTGDDSNIIHKKDGQLTVNINHPIVKSMSVNLLF